MSSLNARQERFCQHFVIDPNATRAAMAAGYSPYTARQQGSRLLGRRRVQDRIAMIRRDMAREHCLDLDTLMGKLEAVYRRAMEDHAFAAAARAIELQARFAGLLPNRGAGGDGPTPLSGTAARPAAPQRAVMSATSRS